ncbi:MAG: site-specific recombinase [Planctomycetes bacterium]|nr:site-specific recombinase [Planctomycetota bacterium]
MTYSAYEDLAVAIERAGRAELVGERRAAWCRLLRDLLEADDLAAALARARAVLDQRPDLRADFQRSFAELAGQGNALTLFAEAGMPGERGLLAELVERVLRRCVPAPGNDVDLARTLGRVLASRDERERFENLDDAASEQLFAFFADECGETTAAPLRVAFADAVRLLASRAASEGLSAKLRERTPNGPVSQSAFHVLRRASDDLADAWLERRDLTEVLERWRRARAAVPATLAELKHEVDGEGISIDIVYGLEVIERSLARLDLAIDVLAGRTGALRRWIAALAHGVDEQRRIGSLLRGSTRRLHRRIVERSGQTGEHYIAKTKREYGVMWLAAAGGGLLTTSTAALKLAVHGLHLAPFQEGMLYGLNYAIAFLLLQTLHLTLATKQPAMTAAHLAALVREHRGAKRLEEIVDWTARIVRSQLAAAIANVTFVSIGAFVFAQLWRATFGHPFVEEEVARATYTALSPLDSGTILFAALTGVILWLASLAGGWIENWVVYRRIPRVIAEFEVHSPKRRERLQRLSARVERDIGGWATSVSLGFLLGMTPAFGLFLGVPLDVRHVTLSTGTLALAAASLDQHWFLQGGFLHASAGIAVMFVLNLGVSFGLSLFTALRAFELSLSEFGSLFRRLGRRLATRPSEFLWPND